MIRWGWLLLLGLVACEADPVANVPVESGEFVIDIETTGELRAVNSRVVTRPRRGWSRSQIVRMVDEGSVVEENGFLIQFDTAEAERELQSKQNDLKNAEAELASQRATAISGVAELRSKLENQKFSYEQAKIRTEQMKYEADIRRREQELEMRKAELALQEAEEKINSQRVINEANLRKAELAVEQAGREVDKQRDVLNQLTLNSPIGGLVVYKEVWNQSGNRAKVKVGDTPWPGQELIEIPDLSEMLVRTKVNEIDIHQVAVDQDVTITVDALPDTTFTGVVKNVATLAKREGNSEVKTFELEVAVHGSDVRLRPGMTAKCRVVTKRIPDSLFVPLDAVFEEGGETVCYVGGSGDRRVVTLGPRNADHVVVEAGLEPDDTVSLRDPHRPLEDVGDEPPPAES